MSQCALSRVTQRHGVEQGAPRDALHGALPSRLKGGVDVDCPGQGWGRWAPAPPISLEPPAAAGPAQPAGGRPMSSPQVDTKIPLPQPQCVARAGSSESQSEPQCALRAWGVPAVPTQRHLYCLRAAIPGGSPRASRCGPANGRAASACRQCDCQGQSQPSRADLGLRAATTLRDKQRLRGGRTVPVHSSIRVKEACSYCATLCLLSCQGWIRWEKRGWG